MSLRNFFSWQWSCPCIHVQVLIVGIKRDLWAVIWKETTVTHEPHGNYNSSKHQCSHDGYKQRVLEIPNLRFQLEIQRQREEEKRWKTRDFRWKKTGWQKEGIRKHVGINIRIVRNTLHGLAVCVCVWVRGGGQSKLQPWWRRWWSWHRRPTNRVAQINLIPYKHLHSLKVLTTSVCNHLSGLSPVSPLLITSPAVMISWLTSVCCRVLGGKEITETGKGQEEEVSTVSARMDGSERLYQEFNREQN